MVHRCVHVPFQVERVGVPHEARDLAPKDVKSFHGGDQDSRRLLDTQRFRRVLLLLAHGAQVLVVLGQSVHREELLESLSKVALVALRRQWDIECESFVECVGLIVASLALDLRSERAPENLEQRSLRLVFDHV